MIQTGNTQHNPPASLPYEPNLDSLNSFGTNASQAIVDTNLNPNTELGDHFCLVIPVEVDH